MRDLEARWEGAVGVQAMGMRGFVEADWPRAWPIPCEIVPAKERLA